MCCALLVPLAVVSGPERDTLPENSWQQTAEFNPDREVERSKFLQLGLFNLFPMDPNL